LVKIGDFLPDIQLPDLSGEMKKLSDLRGARLTVVLFWSTREALGREQFRRFRVETAQLFRSSGVNVVAINVGDDADSVRKLYESAKADFPCLLDKEKSEFGSVATAKLPRTYLLDAQGRIVWLEMEYSCDARRELTNAVYFFLNARPPVEERS
jgi:peroxiredoxin